MVFDWSILFWSLSTLGGAIVGGLLSRWTTRSLEMQRWRREDAKRFEADRRRAYIELLRLINEFALLKGDREEIHPELKRDFMNILAEIEIISSPETRQRALAFGQVISDYFSGHSREQYSAEAWSTRRKELIDAIHRELGIGTQTEQSDRTVSALLPGELAKNISNFRTQTNLPLPVVTGAIGLILAFSLSGGLSGGQGFLVGFIIGISILIFIAIRLDSINTK